MRKFLMLLTCVVSAFTVKAQSEGDFNFEGKPIVTLFANYAAGVGETNAKSGFNLNRCYLGYEANFASNLSAKVVFNVGDMDGVSDLQRVAYLKKAYVRWEKNKFAIDFGVVSMLQYEFQQNFWGHRYVAKSYQGEYDYYPSGDLGVIAYYTFNDYVSVDLSVSNGEGYKKLNTDNGNRYGVGATLTPLKNLTLRAYYDYYESDGQEGNVNEYSLATFVGYKNRYFSVAAEYNAQYNSRFADEHDRKGVSLYANGVLTDKWSVFCRYDKGVSNNDWDVSKDAEYVALGVQYKINKYLKVSPNLQSRNYTSTGVKDNFFYISAEFKL